MILHEEITLSEADAESVVSSAGTHFAVSINLHVPLKRNFLRRIGEESPGWFLEQLVGDHSKTYEDAGREADIEGGYVDVVYGAPALPISGFEYQGFTFSEIVSGKWLDGQTLSEGVIDTARPPQCEFSNLQKLPLTFYSDLLAGRLWNSFRLVMLSALKNEDDFVRLLCWVHNFSGQPFVHPDSSGTSRIYFSGSEFEVVAPTPEADVRKKASRKRFLTAVLES